MAGQEAVWHVLIDEDGQGPLTKAQVLERLRDGLLAGSDLIWRPGLADWKSISEISDFWQPPKRASREREPIQPPIPVVDEPDRIVAPPSGKQQWSLWRSANYGLLLSACSLLVRIADGRGFELAAQAHTASADTISALLGRILAGPLLFVLVAVIRNLLYRRQPKSNANAVWGAATFVALVACMLGALMVYGEAFFSSPEKISGETRKAFIAKFKDGCTQKQRLVSQDVSEAQIDKYCSCISENFADNTTYRGLANVSAPELVDLMNHFNYVCR